jgi:hypothetical protein
MKHSALITLVSGFLLLLVNTVASGQVSTSTGPLPFGGVAPPSGQSWHLLVDDEFSQDSSINTTLWNGNAGAPNGTGVNSQNGYPMCYQPCTTSSDCQTSFGLSCTQDCLGYAGGAQGNECQPLFSGTPSNGYTFSDSIIPGTGLVVQAAYDASNPLQYYDNTWAGLQSYNKLIFTAGNTYYIEWMAQEPTDVSGEGDGLHTDLWCTANNRTLLSGGDEVDVNEDFLSTGSRNSTLFALWEVNVETGYASYGVDAGGSAGPNLDHSNFTG